MGFFDKLKSGLGKTKQTINEKIDIKYKTVMGVEIPSIIYEKPQKELKYGLYNTSIQVDEVLAL